MVALDKTKEDFLLNDQCKYVFQAPLLSAKGDILSLNIYKLEQARGWVFYGSSYENITSQVEVSEKQTYSTTYPNKIFFLVQSNSIVRGYFEVYGTY